MREAAHVHILAALKAFLNLEHRSIRRLQYGSGFPKYDRTDESSFLVIQEIPRLWFVLSLTEQRVHT